MASFDSMKFLRENFADRSKIPGRLRVVGANPVPDDETVRKWFKREKVSAEQVINLIYCREIETGRAVSLAPYMEG